LRDLAPLKTRPKTRRKQPQQTLQKVSNTFSSRKKTHIRFDWLKRKARQSLVLANNEEEEAR